MANWKGYTTKSAVEDTDELMIADATANVNKRTPLSILWNWIVGKLTSAVIANLETNSKSVVGALNELNSKGKTIETTIGAGKEYTVSLEDHSIYMLVYYELGNGNINDGSVNCAVIVSRQADEKTGGIYTTATSSEEDISLENNILKITAGTWWVRVCIKKL